MVTSPSPPAMFLTTSVTVSIMSTSLCSGLCHYYSIVCTKDKSYYTAFACVCLVLASVIA